MTDLLSRTALVTGASRGIGRATARALAAAGARVIVHYGNSAKEAESLVAEIRASGGRADAVGADLGAPDGAHKLAAEVRKLVGDRLDILIANAGIATPASIEDQTVEEFDRMFAVNVRAPFFLVQQLLPLLGDGSSVVLMSSLAARASIGVLPAYAATKGAIDTMVKHFAALLGSRGIRVNAVAPGVIDTDMSSFVRSDEGRAYTLGIQALQRIGHPDDVAEVATFLASDAARWVTGDTIQAGGDIGRRPPRKIIPARRFRSYTELKMKLYQSNASPNSRRVRIYLAEKGISMPLVPVDLGAKEQFSAAYAAINPRRVVPTLVLDDGTAIGEVPAILRYLEEIHPEPPLFGTTPKTRAQVAMWERRVELEGFASAMEAVRNAVPGLKNRAIAGPHDYEQIPALVERSRQRIRNFYADFNARLDEVPFVAGDTFSVADITAVVTVDFATRAAGVPIAGDHTALQRWYDSVSARASMGA